MPHQKHGYPRPVILKDGSQVELALLEPQGQREQLMAFFSRLPAGDRWYLAYDVSDEEVVRGWLRNFDRNLALPVVATTDEGRIAALCTLHRYGHGARGHIGRLRVMVDPEFRGQRLGTYMLLDLIQLAMDLGLSLLVSEFIKGVEDKGLRAARRLDFFEQAVIPDYAQDRRGNRYDLAIMVKRIHRGWDDF